MKNNLIAILASVLIISLLLTGCKEETTADSQDLTPEDNTPQPPQPVVKTASVQFGNYSCVITAEYKGDVRGVLRNMGAKYAREYELKVDGIMTGSEGAQAYITTSPTIGTATPDSFSCGAWEADNIMHTCTRTASSPEKARFSYVMHGYGEQVNVAPNLRMEIIATMSIDYDEKDKKVQEIQCPGVNY